MAEVHSCCSHGEDETELLLAPLRGLLPAHLHNNPYLRVKCPPYGGLLWTAPHCHSLSVTRLCLCHERSSFSLEFNCVPRASGDALKASVRRRHLRSFWDSEQPGRAWGHSICLFALLMRAEAGDLENPELAQLEHELQSPKAVFVFPLRREVKLRPSRIRISWVAREPRQR
jgi:hypothetical protein